MTTARSSEELDALAEALYNRDAGWRDFARTFTGEELVMLSDLCTLTPTGGGRAYDDEVFDAIALGPMLTEEEKF